MTNQDIFKRAWTIAKLASFHFGGSSTLYFSESLKQAHSENKTHCRIRKYNWNFSEVNSYIEITTPKNQVIRITKYIIRTRTQHSKFILDLAKKSVALLSEDQIAILINLSNVNF